jgi:hypothetical protein
MERKSLEFYAIYRDLIDEVKIQIRKYLRRRKKPILFETYYELPVSKYIKNGEIENAVCLGIKYENGEIKLILEEGECGLQDVLQCEYLDILDRIEDTLDK